MTETTRVFSIRLPVDVAEQVERTAAIEGLSIDEVFAEGVRAYRAAKVRKFLEESQAEFRRAGIVATEEDVVQWVKEVRAAKSKSE